MLLSKSAQSFHQFAGLSRVIWAAIAENVEQTIHSCCEMCEYGQEDVWLH